MACFVCYLLAKKDPMANVWMIILATCELYGGTMPWFSTPRVGTIDLLTANPHAQGF